MTDSQSNATYDPAELAKAYAEIAQRSSEIVSRYIATHSNGATPVMSDELGIAKAFYDMMGKLFADPAKIASAKTTAKEAAPPLPYNLLKLQTDAARKFGYKPNQVKDITQALREKHRLITYNRSDSEYLSDEQHADAPGVLAAVAATAPT